MAGSSIRSKFHFATEASQLLPSWNFTPCLSLNVYTFASGETSHEVARSATKASSAVGLTRSPSTFWHTTKVVGVVFVLLSRFGEPPVDIILSVPPLSGAPVPDELELDELKLELELDLEELEDAIVLDEDVVEVCSAGFPGCDRA